MKITVIGQAKAKPGMEEKVKEELLRLVSQTRSEPGCATYDLHQAMEDKSVFISHESWESRAAFEAHLEQLYVKAVLARAEELFVGPVEITLWEKIS